MAKHEVTCRICKQKFDARPDEEGSIWVMPSKNFYYHKHCYDNWKSDKNDIKANKSDEEWIGYIYDYFAHDLKVSYDYRKCESQRQNFINKKGYTNKGIFFTLKYYYDTKRGDWSKSEGGIGIVPYVYSDACSFWAEQVRRQSDILLKIEEQMAARAARPTLIIKPHKQAKKVSINLDEIMED